jgi:hypothetical protein
VSKRLNQGGPDGASDVMTNTATKDCLAETSAFEWCGAKLQQILNATVEQLRHGMATDCHESCVVQAFK